MQPFTIGVALKKEKFGKHVSARLIEQAANEGLHLKQVDVERPLQEQEPLHAILQKIRLPEWEQHLEQYALQHPELQVYDLPSATYAIRNRGTMLSMVDEEGWVFEHPAAATNEPSSQQPQPRRCRCSVPLNITLAEGTSYEAALRRVRDVGMCLPLVAKPIWADGREGSHALAVVSSLEGLRQLIEGPRAAGGFGPPCLLEQYVDHGGCLFKVYVLADRAVRVKRASLALPQLQLEPLGGQLEPMDQEPASGSELDGSGPLPELLTDQHQQQQHLQEAAPVPIDGSWAAPLGSAAALASSAAVAEAAAAGAPAEGQPAAADAMGSSPPAHTGVSEWDQPPDLEFVERVSAYPRAKSWGKSDLAPKGHGVPSPPAWFIDQLAQRLRAHLGLSLFNFDLIVPMQQVRKLRQEQGPGAAAAAAGVAQASAAPVNGSAEQEAAAGQPTSRGTSGAEAVVWPTAHDFGELEVALLDINFFPGYEKLPNYEVHMMEFLRSLPAKAQQRAGGT